MNIVDLIKNYDGKTVVSQGFAIYGTPISAPIAPKKESEDASKAVYEFVGWKETSAEGRIISENEEILSKFMKAYPDYTEE